MTLAYPERPDTKAQERPASPPPRFATSAAAVTPARSRGRTTRVLSLAALAAGGLGLLALAPWHALPRDGESLRNVGVPRQYREIMDHSRVEAAPVSAREVESDDPLVSLTPHTPRPAEPPAAVVAESPAMAPSAAPRRVSPDQAAPPADPRPRAMAYTARTMAAPPPTGPAMAEVAKAEALPSYRVQIAAAGTDAEAEAAWRDLRRAFPDETQDRNLSVRLAQVKGRVVRRALVTGFPSSEAAKAFCARLAAADRGCILRGKG